MAIFTDIEKELLSSVTDDDLCSNLEAIHKAMKEIWAPDMPRIIQDYTDHGIKHSRRVAGFTSELLKANDGNKISSQEMYLLLAGIYLHDIGMQCDVVRYPKIKAKAEEIGAQFAIDFKSKKSNEYTTEEQKEIRKNHHYLSAAWIDYAYKSGETVLGKAAREIPSELVSDLMDVCKHHAKLPITDCPPTFRYSTNERKQLVAAILRFSDELDIDRNRVSTIEAINSFNLDPQNKVYWWLHKCTKVIFNAPNVVILTILLHPDDKKKYGSVIHDTFIQKFSSKNKPILLVLKQNGIPITIDAGSNVEENEYEKAFPEEIVKALALLQELDPVTELAEEVCTWLQAIRYEVSEPQYSDDRTTDMIATLNQGTIKQRVLVRCIEGEITQSDVGTLDTLLDRKIPQGWIISDKRVASKAREKAAEDDSIQIFNLADFLRQMVWGPYFDYLKSTVEKSNISDLYVDISCYKLRIDENGSETDKDRYLSLDAYIDDWLTERGKTHISLLGEFGTGKTWFCQHYAYRQLKRYLKDPAHERLPLLITLRAFTKAMTAKQLINDALLEQYELPFVGSAFNVFQEISQKGKLLLILDGFDEMARQTDYQTVVDNFWELANLAKDGSKVILTSRTEYFRSAEESEKILGGEEYGRNILDLQPPKFEVLYLEPFTNDQIREVITLRLGEEKGPAVAERILKRSNLAEMACKPVLVELLLAALDEVSDDVLKTPAQVYLYATNKLLLRNIDTKRTFTKTADKLYFLCELAWEMIKSGELRIHYTDIPDRIKNYFGERIKDQHELDNWDFDLHSQTLLHRNAAGYYEFAHKSLAEYFVAFKFAAELGCLAPDFIQTYCEAEGESCVILIEQKDVIGLAETFGEIALKDKRMQAVKRLMKDMISENAIKRLWKVIDETKGKTPEKIKYVGGNAATLLQMNNESFREAKLANTVLSGAYLKTDLTKANLQGACLKDVVFRSCIFDQCDFRNTNLQDASFFSPGIRTLEYTLDGKLLIAGGTDGYLRLWHTSNYEYVASIKGHFDNIFALCCDVNSKYLTSVSYDGIIKVWNILERQEVSKTIIKGVTNISFDLNVTDVLIICTHDSIISWNFIKNTESKSLFKEPIQKIAFNPDGKHLAISKLGYVDILEAPSRTHLKTLPGYKKNSRVHDLIYSPNGNFLAISGIGYVKIWNTQRWELETTFTNKSKSRWFTHICFSPNERWIASGCNFFGRIRVWDISSQKLVLSQKGHNSYIGQVQFNPNGDCLATASGDGTVCIWDFMDESSTFGQCLKVLTAKTNCKGMLISGASGLKQNVEMNVTEKAQKRTLLEFFAEGGAILDDEQKQILAEAQKIVPDTI